jgi:hypothetical protein
VVLARRFIQLRSAAGDYIYVAAWDDAQYGAPHMWIGEFTVGSTTLYSNTTDWTTKYDNTVKSPSAAQVSALVQSAAPWLAPQASMPNGSSPYGSLIGGAPASMIWHDVFDGSSASENGYALFRSLAPIRRSRAVDLRAVDGWPLAGGPRRAASRLSRAASPLGHPVAAGGMVVSPASFDSHDAAPT